MSAAAGERSLGQVAEAHEPMIGVSKALAPESHVHNVVNASSMSLLAPLGRPVVPDV